MTAFVSLFRGINVGGHRKVGMKDLKAMHELHELRDVVPYIQSGNVVFTCDDTEPIAVQQQLEASFEQTFGFRSDVIVRSAAELDTIIENNPFRGQTDKEPNWIIVMFLATQPAATAQEELLKTYSGPEEIIFAGKEVFIYYPNGIGRSKLSNSLLERKLKTVGTARNWNTVLKLCELIQH